MDASHGESGSGRTDPSGQPVPDGFPEVRPPHQNPHPQVPEGEEGGSGDAGSETHAGEPVDHDAELTSDEDV